jgi:hypothetical protein
VADAASVGRLLWRGQLARAGGDSDAASVGRLLWRGQLARAGGARGTTAPGATPCPCRLETGGTKQVAYRTQGERFGVATMRRLETGGTKQAAYRTQGEQFGFATMRRLETGGTKQALLDAPFRTASILLASRAEGER